MRDSTTVLLRFTQPKIPEEVRVWNLQFKVNQHAVLNATDTGLWLITVRAKNDAPVAVLTVGRIVIRPIKDAQIVKETTLLPIKRVRFTNVN